MGRNLKIWSHLTCNNFILQDGKIYLQYLTAVTFMHVCIPAGGLLKLCHFSISTHITAWEPLNRSSWNLIVGSFGRRCWAISVLVKIKHMTLYVKTVHFFAYIFYIHRPTRHHMWKTWNCTGLSIIPFK